MKSILLCLSCLKLNTRSFQELKIKSIKKKKKHPHCITLRVLLIFIWKKNTFWWELKVHQAFGTVKRQHQRLKTFLNDIMHLHHIWFINKLYLPIFNDYLKNKNVKRQNMRIKATMKCLVPKLWFYNFW